MPKKQRKFADDSWAIWIDGDDTSTVYINDWVNPKGKSYVDFAVRVRGIKACKSLNVYMPFAIRAEEIEDVSLLFNDINILRATFSSACIVDYKKNEHTSEIAYNGKTVDIVHISTLDLRTMPLADGTLFCVDFKELQPFLDNDEAYFIWRMPHKTLDEIFTPHVDVGNVLGFIFKSRNNLLTKIINVLKQLNMESKTVTTENPKGNLSNKNYFSKLKVNDGKRNSYNRFMITFSKGKTSQQNENINKSKIQVNIRGKTFISSY